MFESGLRQGGTPYRQEVRGDARSTRPRQDVPLNAQAIEERVRIRTAMQAFNYDAIKDLICCPKTHAALVFTGSELVSCDPEARLRYPIVDGFPVLLVDEATTLSATEWGEVMRQNRRDPATGEKIERHPSV